ncbi:MAG: hypothetical protein ACYSX0_21460 [Planctomycetota bacterium]|jgi:hypothetical protein
MAETDEFDFEAAKQQLGRIRTGTFDHLPIRTRAELIVQMGIAASSEDRLRLSQEARRIGLVPPQVGFFMVALHLVHIADHDTPAELDRVLDEISAIEIAHGLEEDESWKPGEGPAEWEVATAKFARLHDQHVAETMRRLGEHEMAKLYLEDREEFDSQSEEGRRESIRDDPPEPSD